MIHENKARGMELADKHAIINQAGVKADFILADGGGGTQAADYVDLKIQLAHNLKIPCIVKFATDPELYWGGSIDAPMAPPDEEYHFKALDRAVGYSKVTRTVGRVVAGIMVDATKTVQSDGNKITSQWWAKINRYVYENIWNRYRKPVYLFVHPNVLAQYAEDGAGGVMQTWLSQMESVCVWLSAQSGAVQLLPSGSPLPVPPDAYKPTGGYAASWDLARYALSFYQFVDVQDTAGAHPGVPLWISSKTREQLYAELEYTAPSNPPDNPGGGEGDPPPTGDTAQALADIKAGIARIESKLDNPGWTVARGG